MRFIHLAKFCVFLISITPVESVDKNNDSKFTVGIVSSESTLSNSLQVVLDYVNHAIMPENWKTQFVFFPGFENLDLLTDITGAGLYEVADMLKEKNIYALIDPGSSTSVKLIHASATADNLPHLSLFATDSSLGQAQRFPMLIRLCPPDSFQTKAVFDVLQFYGWNRLSLITTDDDYGCGAVDALLAIASKRGCVVEEIIRFQLTNNPEDLPITSTLEKIRSLEPHPIVVVTGVSYGKVIVKTAYLMGMTLARNWLWILMDGAAQDSVPLITYENKRILKNITKYFDGLLGTRPIMSEGTILSKLQDYWTARHQTPFSLDDGLDFMKEKLIDAIISTAEGFRMYLEAATDNRTMVIEGKRLRDAILRVNIDGVATTNAFDPDGKTQSTTYDILISDVGKWKAIGKWSQVAKLKLSHGLVMNYSKSVRRLLEPAKARSFHLNTSRIISSDSISRKMPIIHMVTILESPFLVLSENNTEENNKSNRIFAKDLPEVERIDGMDVKLEGYCVDLIQKLSEEVGFRYTLRLVEDSYYGALNNDTGMWNGMVGDLVRDKSQVALAPLSVTEQRSKVVDFTTSFMDIGLKFIVDRVAAGESLSGPEYDAFAFLKPFHVSLWRAICICVVCLSMFLCLLSKVSPFGMRGHFFLSYRADELRRHITSGSRFISIRRLSHTTSLGKLREESTESRALQRLITEKEDADNAMGINNALYFVWASLFWQTPERVPRAPSARLVTVIWYLAAVVFVASYTANMVTFVSKQQQVVHHLSSVSDLVLHVEIPYGTVAESSVEFIFRSSTVKVAKQMYDVMMSDEENLLVDTMTEGIERVKNGTFALLWDSLSLDYVAAVESDCRLKTVDVGFGAVPYAIGVQHKSPLTVVLSRGIMRLQESGFLSELWRKYFSYVEKCKSRDDKKDYHKARVHQLTFGELAGVFYLVYIAMGVGLIMVISEWIVAGCQDVDESDPSAPKSAWEAMAQRKQRLKSDIAENWLPISKTKNRWSKLNLPLSKQAGSVINDNLKGGNFIRTQWPKTLQTFRRCNSDSNLATISRKGTTFSNFSLVRSLRRLSGLPSVSFLKLGNSRVGNKDF